MNPCYVDGIQVNLHTVKNEFTNVFPSIVQRTLIVEKGNGTAGPYTFTIPISPNNQTPLNVPLNYILRGHVDLSGVIATKDNNDPPIVTDAEILSLDNFIQDVPVMYVFPAVYITANNLDGSSIVVSDSGQFLQNNLNYGLLMEIGKAPNGNLPLTNGPSPNYSTTQNTINYFNGKVQNLYFPTAIPEGVDINVQCYFIQSGFPRNILFSNNTLTFRSPPDKQYLVELDAYLTPAAFLSTSQAVPFGYMSEYIARGAARKILSDTGDVEQFQFYEQLFREQEMLVWKRSQRQFTATRTQTLYSLGANTGFGSNNNYSGTR